MTVIVQTLIVWTDNMQSCRWIRMFMRMCCIHLQGQLCYAANKMASLEK
jgi:hypothetical protein